MLAIDPSSPFTGGAILGDRVRMQDHALDDGVFIRSMATRGHLGGLALATPEAIRVLDAAGFPWVLVETVGVGQVEVEVAGAADTTVVVVNPGWGDAVQATKAGLLEIADVFVINKADRPGADETERDLDRDARPGRRARPAAGRRRSCATVATTGDGAAEVVAARRAPPRPPRADRASSSAAGPSGSRDELRAILVARLLEQVGAVRGRRALRRRRLRRRRSPAAARPLVGHRRPARRPSE